MSDGLFGECVFLGRISRLVFANRSKSPPIFSSQIISSFDISKCDKRLSRSLCLINKRFSFNKQSHLFQQKPFFNLERIVLLQVLKGNVSQLKELIDHVFAVAVVLAAGADHRADFQLFYSFVFQGHLLVAFLSHCGE